MKKKKKSAATPEEVKNGSEAIENRENLDGEKTADGENASEASTAETEVLVGYTLEEVDQMKTELSAAQKEAKANLDSWHRALADYSNLKRRIENEKQQMRDEAIGSVIKPFLDILDDLDLALQNRPSEDVESREAWAEGIELVYRKLLNKLESQGVRLMEAAGQPFDPRFHEAITQEPSDEVESGHIIAVVKPGYQIGERVLRPAMVRVAA